ncbi:MAG: hypothetical protein AAF602_06815 [Myxococcota bacterium]
MRHIDLLDVRKARCASAALNDTLPRFIGDWVAHAIEENVPEELLPPFGRSGFAPAPAESAAA